MLLEMRQHSETHHKCTNNGGIAQIRAVVANNNLTFRTGLAEFGRHSRHTHISVLCLLTCHTPQTF